MNILEQLGVNQTLFLQLGIFVFTILVLSLLVFKPFAEALNLREQKTSGAEDLAAEFQQKTAELHQLYESKARALNDKIRKHFEDSRKLAQEEYEKSVAAAKLEAQHILTSARSQIQKELATAKAGLKDEVPKVASDISKKLLSSNERIAQ